MSSKSIDQIMKYCTCYRVSSRPLPAYVQGIWDLRALADMESEATALFGPQVPPAIIPNYNFSLEQAVNTTTWEWRAERLRGFDPNNQPPVFHADSMSPGGPMRNMVLIVRAMADNNGPDGVVAVGRMVTMLLGERQAKEMTEKRIII